MQSLNKSMILEDWYFTENNRTPIKFCHFHNTYYHWALFLIVMLSNEYNIHHSWELLDLLFFLAFLDLCSVLLLFTIYVISVRILMSTSTSFFKSSYFLNLFIPNESFPILFFFYTENMSYFNLKTHIQFQDLISVLYFWINKIIIYYYSTTASQ